MSKKNRIEQLEKNLVETSDVALLRRDLNTMVHALTATLKGVLEVTKELSEAVEGISREGNSTHIDGEIVASGNVWAGGKPAAKPKAKAKPKPAAKRTVKKSINLDPK